MAETPEQHAARIRRMKAALDAIHEKNQSPAAKAKREKKASRWKRAKDGE